MNAVDQIILKAWNLQEEKLNDIVSQVDRNFQWLYDTLASAQAEAEASGWWNTKPPNLKKRKVEQEKSNKEKPVVIEEAKKPRKLKRNSREKKPRTSRSTRAQSKANAPPSRPVRQSQRVTRAATKFQSVDGNQSSLAAEKSTLKVVEVDVYGMPDDVSKQISNTTKSFCEHEAYMQENITVQTAECNQTFDIVAKQKDNEAKQLSITIDLDKGVTDCKVSDPSQQIDLISAMEHGHVNATKNDTFVMSSPQFQNHSIIQHSVADGTPKQKAQLYSTSTPVLSDDVATDANMSPASNTFALNPEANNTPSQESPQTASPAQKKNQELATRSPKVVMPHIAKIKERLFEKLSSPAAGKKRNSPRMVGKTGKPLSVPNTPAEQPNHARKVYCSLVIPETPPVTFASEDSNETQASGALAKQPFRTQEDDGDKDNDAFSEEICEEQAKSKGPKIVKPVKAKNVISNVHSMIKAANQRAEIIQGPVSKQNNVVTGVHSFIKTNAAPKPETEEERKLRLAEEIKKRDENRKKMAEQAVIKKQKLIEERRRLRQEREQRVADAQAKKAQEEEERMRQAQEDRARRQKENEERARKQKEKDEDMKRRNRERKMAEAEAKRKQEETERLAKLAEKEEEERRKAELMKRKHEYEEQERKRKIEEQKRIEEERLEQCAKERQLQEERIRREIEERELAQKKRQEEKLRKEREEREVLEKKRIERERHEQEVQERLRQEKEAYEKAMREKEAEREKREQEIREKEQREKEAREIERKQREGKEIERKEKELREKERREREAREAYYKKKLEQKQAATTFHSPKVNKVMQPPQLPAKVHCTSYKTPTLAKVQSKIKKTKSPSLVSYDIDNLTEDDSTDDDEDPDQEVPNWAKGNELKKAVAAQANSDFDPYNVFVNMLEPPKLENMFPKLRARFFKRTSSACWEHPPRPFKTML